MPCKTQLWWLLLQTEDATSGVWQLAGYTTERKAIKAIKRYINGGWKVLCLRSSESIVLDADAIAKRFSGSGRAT